MNVSSTHREAIAEWLFKRALESSGFPGVYHWEDLHLEDLHLEVQEKWRAEADSLIEFLNSLEEPAAEPIDESIVPTAASDVQYGTLDPAPYQDLTRGPRGRSVLERPGYADRPKAKRGRLTVEHPSTEALSAARKRLRALGPEEHDEQKTIPGVEENKRRGAFDSMLDTVRMEAADRIIRALGNLTLDEKARVVRAARGERS